MFSCSIIILLCVTFTTPRTVLQSYNGFDHNLIRTKDDSAPRLRFGDTPQYLKETQYCRKTAKCYDHKNATCFGVKLPYSHTSLDIVGDLEQHEVMEHLHQWNILKRVPKCWATIQPFLCSVYMPKCDPETGLMDLPSQDMCKIIMGPCRILNELSGGWPFFKCNDTERFSSRQCKNDVRELKFNTSSECPYPLIQTDNPTSFYEGVDGCGVRCQDPLLTNDEHEHIHKMVALGATASLLCNLFTVVSFFIDWRSGNKYPALIIFYINLCFLISNIGWLIQSVPGTREDIVCKKDGTRRLDAPSAGENLSCIIIFVMVYYFLMAACVWFVILSYAWHLSFRSLGKIPERIDKKGAYFHLVAWSLPLVLTITTMASGQIDGDSTGGVCFVGYSSYFARASLVLTPIAMMVFVGGFFLSRSLTTLIHIKIGSQEIISRKASARIKETIVKILIFSLLCLIFVIVTFICHFYEFKHQEEWKKSLKKFVICRIISEDITLCKMTSRPSVAMIQLHLLVLFGAGIVMSSWVWTSSTVDTWKRFFKRVKKTEEAQEEPLKLKKHKLIAQAFARRKELNCDQRISFDFHSTHTDPVGFNFELNSGESQNLSRTWTEALHKLLTRRGALQPPESNSSRQRNSYDSEISYSVRRVSLESRRHSLDSQISVQIAEVTATRKTSSTAQRAGGYSRSRGKRRRGNRRHQYASRRGSSTSQESQLGIQILSALTMGNSNILPSILKRRAGNAGLEPDDRTGGKFSLPFDLSDDYNSNEMMCDDYHVTNVVTDDDQTNSDDDKDELCSPGEGIQNLDSDNDRSKNLARITYDNNEDEVKVNRRTREKNNRRSKLVRDELMGRSDKVKYLKNVERNGRVKKSERWRSSRRWSNSDIDDDRLKIHNNSSSVEYNKQNRQTLSPTRISDSDYDDTRSVQSRGIQIDARSGSSRSKRSVDVGTQVSAREIATQTDPNDCEDGVSGAGATSSQGTQMTPPFHVRLINKNIKSSSNMSTARGGNYNYSALSLTDQGYELEPMR